MNKRIACPYCHLEMVVRYSTKKKKRFVYYDGKNLVVPLEQAGFLCPHCQHYIADEERSEYGKKHNKYQG